MRTENALLVVALAFGLAACNQAGSAELSSTDPRTAPAQPAAQEPASPAVSDQLTTEEASSAAPRALPVATAGPNEVRVVMSAATLGDDCGGGTVPVRAPAPTNRKSKASSESMDSSRAAARRACQQTSMQLSIAAGQQAATTDVTVKKVQLLDEKGNVVADLIASAPTRWNGDGYKPWDGKITAGQTHSVSYVLSTPVGEAMNDRTKTWTLKAVVTVGGKDQTLQRDVVVHTETILPPGVVT